ncbi:hypothetical protein C0416_04680 [bacterium]|nr:hypothetical protein [bacterium]
MSEFRNQHSGVEANEETLSKALIARSVLQKLGLEIPEPLQEQIAGLEAKSPVNKIPSPKGELAGLSRDEVAKKTKKVLGLQDETEFSPEQKAQLLKTLEARFKANEKRHPEIWEVVKIALEADEEALKSINKMEEAGHEPDVYNFDKKGFDVGSCYRERPSQTCSTYNESVEMRKTMGNRVKHMTAEQYRDHLQTKESFDETLYVWLETDHDLRTKGFAVAGNRSDEEVRVYVHRDDGPSMRVYWRGSLRVSWKNS